MRYNRSSGETVELTQGFDDYADDVTVFADNKTVYSHPARGRTNLYSVPMEPDFRLRIATHVKRVETDLSAFPSFNSLNLHRDGKTIVFASSSIGSPPEVFSARLDKNETRALSKANAALGLTPVEEIEWNGALRTKNHGFIVKPKNFDASKKYPMIVLIHGGPQGAWNDSWSTRWNPQVWANAGYIIFLPNPRGSTGYGQKFINDISGDWGGKVFVDLKNGVAEMVKKPYVDRSNIGAAGASYGGTWSIGYSAITRSAVQVQGPDVACRCLQSREHGHRDREIWFVIGNSKAAVGESVNYTAGHHTNSSAISILRRSSPR